MRFLVIGLVAMAALVAAPAQGAVFAEVSGKWFWSTDGYVRAGTNLGQPAQALIFIADDGSYFYRVSFDPFQRAYVQCANGQGFLFLSGPSVPLSSCSLELQGAFAVPRARVGADAGSLPGAGAYLGALALGLSGTGSFRLA